MNVIEKFSDREAEGVTHAELVSAILTLATDLSHLKTDLESGRFTAKVTDIDPETLLTTSGQG